MKSDKFGFHKGRSYLDRPIDRQEIKQRFLITCEGKKTEPNYFGKFRTPKIIEVIEGYGFNTMRLVEETIRLMKLDDYDQVWCVFDKDSFPTENVEKAISLARKNKINVAYSNESFELWYLLHFDLLTTALTRHDYVKRLSDRFKFSYDKTDKDIYDNLLQLQNDAIRNAKKLLEQYSPYNPDQSNPSTTVHLLVEQLNRFRSL